MNTNLLTFILFIFSAINLFSCNFNKKEIKNNPTEPIDCIAENATSTREIAQEDINKDDKPKVGESIYGDFDGNGTYEYAYIELTKKGNGGNPIDGAGIPDEYAIKFTDKTFPIFSFYPGCCETLLINEGDLNNDGSDEISLFHAPMNGCCYDWMTLTLHNGKWEQLIDMLLLCFGCEGILPKDELQDVITLENGIIYKNTDFSYSEDENGFHCKFNELSKEKANLKTNFSK